jgi:hypothetical protein
MESSSTNQSVHPKQKCLLKRKYSSKRILRTFSSCSCNADWFLDPIVSQLDIIDSAECSLLKEPAEISPYLSKVSNILDLPLELRHRIYDYIFQAPVEEGQQAPSTGVWFPIERFEHHRGNSLTLACSQMYGEARVRYYNCAKYNFVNAWQCEKFLKSTGPISHHIGSLDIQVNDEFAELEPLRAIFNTLLPVAELHTLKLQLLSKYSERVSLPPLYLPFARLKNPAAYYDLSLCPKKHPLAKITSVRDLLVEGHTTTHELEEAIVKLSLNIEELADKERRAIEVNSLVVGMGLNPMLCYSLRITDPPST